MPIIRNISSIVNRTNNCGGNKKAGLAPSVGGRSRFAMKTVKVNAVNTIPVVKCGSGGRGCPRNFSNNPGGQACGGVGRMAQLATRGIVPPGGRGGGVPRETITLVTARARGGVRANQDLVLRTDDYEEDGNNIIGLQISNNQTFTVAAGGTITFADPITINAIEDIGTAVGIRVETGCTFRQEGGAITFQGDITSGLNSGDFAYGIFINSGTFTQTGGAITFEGAITGSQVADGINNNGGAFSQTGGTITFRGDISGAGDFADGINTNDTFRQTGGAITFQGAITGNNTATGIINQDGTFTQQGGAITFEGLLTAPDVRLVNQSDLANDSFTVNGTIAFPGTNYNPTNFNPNPAATPPFAGNGTITYNNDNETPDTYY